MSCINNVSVLLYLPIGNIVLMRQMPLLAPHRIYLVITAFSLNRDNKNIILIVCKCKQ